MANCKFVEWPEHRGFKVGDHVVQRVGYVGYAEGFGVGYVRVRWPGLPGFAQTYSGRELEELSLCKDPRIAPAFKHLADWLKFRPGDIVECIDDLRDVFGAKLRRGDLYTVDAANIFLDVGPAGCWNRARFRLAGRPGAGGWVAWFGGPNPVPGKRVRVYWTGYEGASETANGHALRGYKVIEEPGMTDSVAATPEEYGFFDAPWPSSDALLRDRAYKAWLDEERDGRLRSAFEAGWKAAKA